MKELKLEAERLYPVQLEDDWDKNKQYRDEWISGVTSKFVEKQKLEFTIQQLKYLHNLLTYDDLAEDEKIESCKEYIQDLQKKLLNL